MIERTLSIIKPDATERNITGEINAIIEKNGYRIIAQKRIKMDRSKAERFYDVHRDKVFFDDLVSSMTVGPVVVQVLEGPNVILGYRELMGATNPSEAAHGTLRRLFARSIGENSVHGSDSSENAIREIAFFFDDEELVG